MTEQTATATTPEATAGRDPKWWTLVAVCLGIFILLLDITIVNVALADIQSELGASLSDLQWVIDAYALSLAVLLLTAGSLADLYGRRKVFVIGAALFMVGSIACGAAQDIFFLQLARAFQGIGGAAMFATALALIASAYQGRDRGVAFGAFGATTGVAVAIGPVLGGVLTSGLSWRWIFFVNIPICLLAIAIAVARVRESHDPRAGRPDWFGFGTFSLALAGLVYGLIRAGQTQWDDGRVVVLPRGGGGAAGPVRGQPAGAGQPDVRPRAAPQADVHRRADRGVRGLRLGVLAADLPGDLRPERAGLLRGRRRRPVPLPLRCRVLSRRHRRPTHRERARQVADRTRLRPARRGDAAHPRHRGRLVLDPPDPRSARQRRRRRHDQHPAGLDRGRRRDGRPLGHGFGHQLHVPAGGHRHRHRRPRHDLQPTRWPTASEPAWPARPPPISPTGSRVPSPAVRPKPSSRPRRPAFATSWPRSPRRASSTRSTTSP